MATEIEHKFLVVGDEWRKGPSTSYRQGYLSIRPDAVVRVRIGGGKGYLTVKGANVGVSRPEFEYEIPESDAEEIIAGLCGTRVIEKTRHRIRVGTHTWEVDEFHGANEGLVVAEIELEFEGQPFEMPTWVTTEVSDEPRYTNAMLATHPFSRWPKRNSGI